MSKSRFNQLLAMPPEPLEIVAGLGAIVWSLGWGRFMFMQHLHFAGPAYLDLARLPSFGQGMIVMVALIGGSLQIATAWVNEATLRCVAQIGMAVFWLLITGYVWYGAGFFGPTVACYLEQLLPCAAAVLMLWRSGYVRWRI